MRKTKIRSNLRPVGGPSIAGLVSVAKNEPKEFARKFENAVQNEGLRLEDIRDWRGFLDKLENLTVEVEEVQDNGDVRSVQTSAFPIATGTLALAGVMDAFDAVPDITSELVTEIDDVKKVTRFIIIREYDNDQDSVPEGDDFPPIAVGEDFVNIGSVRNGRRLSMTREAIAENDIVNFISQVNWLGKWFRDWSTRLTLRRVCDLAGSGSSPAEPYAYHPQGSGTQLYNASVNSPSTRAPLGTRLVNNALNDYTDLDNARLQQASFRSERERPINNPMSSQILLVPTALEATAFKILGSEFQDDQNQLNAWGTRGIYRPKLLSTTELDAFATGGSTTWYLGDFKSQFIRKWQYRMDFVQAGQETESYLRNLIAFQASVSGALEYGALHNVQGVQNLSNETPPAE